MDRTVRQKFIDRRGRSRLFADKAELTMDAGVRRRRDGAQGQTICGTFPLGLGRRDLGLQGAQLVGPGGQLDDVEPLAHFVDAGIGRPGGRDGGVEPGLADMAIGEQGLVAVARLVGLGLGGQRLA